MRVAIDISHLNHEKLSGVGVYTLELMRGLRTLQSLDLVPVFRPSRWKSKRFFKMHIGQSRPWLPMFTEWQSQILHGPDFRVGPTRKAARVASIMDLAFLQEGMTSPEFAKKKKADLDSLLDEHTPDALIAISEATRRALITYRPQLAARVHTVLLGGDHMQRLTSTLDSQLKERPPYFLFVGNLEARKNVLGILKAFEQFCANSPIGDLILIGKPGFDGEAIVRAAETHPFAKRIHVEGYCSLNDLQAYYRYAIALVYPSWIEGFGIPVIEAMQLGCPVITSSTTSTAEIAGPTGFLIEPHDTEAIARAMSEVIQLDPVARKARITQAQLRASGFTWQRCAQETAVVYNLALKTRGAR